MAMKRDCDPGTLTLPPPLLFCDFLQHRLHTENVELLKRIVDEFLREPSEFETLREMGRLAFPMVTILPVDRGNAGRWEDSRALVMRMRDCAKQRKPNTALFRDLYDAIKTKIVLVNWDWLLQMFEEFCVGEERTAVAFVARQIRAIAIVPVRPLSTASSARTAGSTLPSKPPTKHDVPKRERLGVQTGADQKMPAPGGSYALTSGQRLTENRETLFVEYCVVESQEPWAALYGVSKAQLPRVARDHAWLVRSLSRFWRRHARAVWERKFWFRYARDHTHNQVQHERARRQDNAVQSYEHTVLVPCYEHFGAQFFVDLDARDARASWWWYRQPIVDIVRLCDRDGLAVSVEYLRSQTHERFPRRPPGCELRNESHYADGRSMWSPRQKYQFITDEIDELKRQQYRNGGG